MFFFILAVAIAIKIRTNKFLMYVPKQHEKVVFRAVGMAIWAAQWGHEDHALGWRQAPVSAEQRRDLPVAASSQLWCQTYAKHD